MNQRIRLVRFLLKAISLSLALASFGLSVSCSKPPSSEALPTWKAEDHEKPLHALEPRLGEAQGGGMAEGPEKTKKNHEAEARTASEEESLAASLWSAKCASCHGLEGKGGASGGVRVADLTSKEVQSRSDAELAHTIARGKNAMPPFPLSTGTTEALVRKIRKLK